MTAKGDFFQVGMVHDLATTELLPPFEAVQEVVTQAYNGKYIEACSYYFTLCIDCLHGLNWNGVGE